MTEIDPVMTESTEIRQLLQVFLGGRHSLVASFIKKWQTYQAFK